MLNAIQEGKSGIIHNELARYRERGQVLPVRIMQEVPLPDRLPGLTEKYGRAKISALLSVALTNCFEKMNIRKDMNGEQIVELAEEIINTAEEDQLAIEDVLMFLDGLLKAKYGKIYDRMDIPTFFEFFERYREARHQELLRFREEQNAQFRALGTTDRSSNYQNKEEHSKALAAFMVQYKDSK